MRADVCALKKLFSSFFSCGSLSSLFGSSGSLSFSLSGSEFCFLLCNSFSLSGILGLFFFKTLFVSKFLGRSYRNASCVNGSLFFLLPSFETTLSFSFVKSTFFNTTLEVLHQKHTFLREDSANCVGGLSTNVYPIQSPFEIQSYCSRISVRIIRTYPFNKFTISWCPAIGDNNRIKRIVLATMAL